MLPLQFPLRGLEILDGLVQRIEAKEQATHRNGGAVVLTTDDEPGSFHKHVALPALVRIVHHLNLTVQVVQRLDTNALGDLDDLLVRDALQTDALFGKGCQQTVHNLSLCLTRNCMYA